MVFAAGMGTRLQPLTNNCPKALVELGGQTLLERTIERLKKAGVEEVVVNVHHFPDQIIGFIKNRNNFGINISVSDEREMLLDTGGGLKKAQSFLQGNESFLICNVDLLASINLCDLVEYHKKSGAMVTLVVRERNTSRYLLFDNNNNLVGWKNISSGVEKIVNPSADSFRPLAFSGIHVVSPEIFPLIDEEGKFSIIDLYLRLAHSQIIKGYFDESPFWMDLGKIEQMKEALQLIQRIDLEND